MIQSAFAGELEANRFTVKRVLELAQRGALRVPPFQRPLRWRRADHLLLLDSLYRGYPVGTLLLWRRAAKKATLSFGEFSVHAPEMQDAFWIVDGQQRITAIVGCFLRPDLVVGRRTSEFAFWFDLEEEKFVAADVPQQSWHIPVNRLRDPVATSAWAREVGADDALHEKAQTVGARLLAYEIPAYVTHAESDDVLRTIFARTNTAGKQMRREEVFEALNKGLHPAASPKGLTERLRDGVRALNFGTIDSDDLQRALICVAGYNPKISLPDELRAPGAATRWEQATSESMRRTVMFLRDEAQIPHAQAMPYVLPFILLPRFFHLYPSPGERTIELLVRWIWRGIASQTHMATNQQFTPHYKALRAGSEEAVTQALLALVPRSPPSSLPESEVYNPRGMRTKLELASLYRLCPRSLEDEHELSPVEIFEPDPPEEPHQLTLDGMDGEERRIGARVVFDPPRLPVAEPALRKLVSARFLHPTVRGGNSAFARALREASPRVLRTHGVDAQLEVYVRQGSWTEVVRGRGRATRELVVKTILGLARWGEDDDGPSLEALLAADDAVEAV